MTENFNSRISDVLGYVPDNDHKTNEALRDIVKTAIGNAMPAMYDEIEIEATKVILVNCVAFLNRAIGRDAVTEILQKMEQTQ